MTTASFYLLHPTNRQRGDCGCVFCSDATL